MYNSEIINLAQTLQLIIFHYLITKQDGHYKEREDQCITLPVSHLQMVSPFFKLSELIPFQFMHCKIRNQDYLHTDMGHKIVTE